MEVLSSRVVIHPGDWEACVRFYTETLGLQTYREFGTGGRITGVVLFLGGGFLEISSGSHVERTGPAVLWLQVPDLAAEEARLRDDVEELIPAEKKPWGLLEWWIADPDGNRVVLVEVPPDHPIRRRVS